MAAKSGLGDSSMTQRLRDYRVFWREFRENFHTTGAVLPSGRLLARALARYVGQGSSAQRILEVGPGTGAVTASIVRVLRPGDRFDLVELNDQFVANLRERFDTDPAFVVCRDRSRVLHQGVEELVAEEPYDVVVSGLPLNNFSIAQVDSILATFRRLLRRGGVLSFFEYIAIRAARSVVSRGSEKTRIRGISRSLGEMLGPHEFRRDWIWPNVPPAWVHHVKVPASE